MKRILMSLSISLMLFVSCKDDEGPTNINTGGGKIEVQDFISAGTVNVGSGGGVVTVKGGGMDGLSITIPPGGMKDSKTFTISTAVVKSHTFGADFNPLTPLIRVDYGGGYLDSVMTIKVPVTVPQGKFAMGFYYDAETGELEGIPVVAINNDNIVLATRHFSGKHLSDGRLGGILSTKTFAEFIVSFTDVTKLFEQSFDSDFRTGVDDWEYPNWGSYLAPGGHCTGQSMTAMWYFQVRKKAHNDRPLYDKFSKVPEMWQDNRDGYRFSSVVWKDQTVPGRVAWMQKFDNWGTQRFSRDSLHFMAFAYSIMQTKQPQLVEVWHNTGGHAMVVYRVILKRLWIADPNFPDKMNHFITFDGAFNPYESRANAGDVSRMYPSITYVGKSSLFSFEKIASRYDEMTKHIIGDNAPDNFPKIDLKWYDGKNWNTVGDTLSLNADTVILAGTCVGCGEFVKDNLTHIELISEKGEHVDWSDKNTGQLKVKLLGGENKVPIVFWGSKGAGKYGYVDFKMPIIVKEKQAKFEYWLRGIDKDGDTIHFGAKEGTMGFPGTWSGNTFKVDVKKQITEKGQAYTVIAKFTVVCNSSRTMINSFNVEETIELGTDRMVLISAEGKNLALSSTEGDDLIFYTTGSGPCAVFTRVDFTFWGGAERWMCDDESFIKFVIPKP